MAGAIRSEHLRITQLPWQIPLTGIILLRPTLTPLIGTSGKSVGLPDGQMGNSEVGHLTIGCGKNC